LGLYVLSTFCVLLSVTVNLFLFVFVILQLGFKKWVLVSVILYVGFKKFIVLVILELGLIFQSFCE
jgi:hypothetical protein